MAKNEPLSGDSPNKADSEHISRAETGWTAAVEYLVRELIVALEAKGHLSRGDVAKLLMRAELASAAEDRVSKEISRNSEAVRIIGGAIERRIGAMQEVAMLRRRTYEWIMSGSPGGTRSHPAHPDRIEVGDDDNPTKSHDA